MFLLLLQVIILEIRKLSWRVKRLACSNQLFLLINAPRITDWSKLFKLMFTLLSAVLIMSAQIIRFCGFCIIIRLFHHVIGRRLIVILSMQYLTHFITELFITEIRLFLRKCWITYESLWCYDLTACSIHRALYKNFFFSAALSLVTHCHRFFLFNW